MNVWSIIVELYFTYTVCGEIHEIRVRVENNLVGEGHVYANFVFYNENFSVAWNALWVTTVGEHYFEIYISL